MKRRIVESHSCAECEVGRASGLGGGQFCPFIDRRKRAGELLYLEGERATHVWYVKGGTVALYRDGSDDSGAERTRAVRFPGNFVGLEALVSERYADSARACSDLVICGATREGMDAWLGPRGTPARTALEMTLRAQRTDDDRRVSHASAVARVARWLADDGPRGVTASLPRKVVADLLGMRPETFSRALAKIAERGAISTTRTTLRVIDDTLLSELARC